MLDVSQKRLDTIGLIDRIVPRASREKGPSIGEYFFYAWANRLIAPRSKRALSDWYRHTARKHGYTLEGKLESLRETLLEFRRKYRERRAHWRDQDAIQPHPLFFPVNHKVP